jgi:DNA repair protein RadA/Sms
MLLAVLEKRAGFRLGAKDVFLNIAGGLNVEDPAIDLAVVCAILSSNEELSIPQNFCFAAEVGLAGEIRAVNKIEQRIVEAEKLGFEKIIVSRFNKIPSKNHAIQIIKVSKIEEVVQHLF